MNARGRAAEPRRAGPLLVLVGAAPALLFSGLASCSSGSEPEPELATEIVRGAPLLGEARPPAEPIETPAEPIEAPAEPLEAPIQPVAAAPEAPTDPPGPEGATGEEAELSRSVPIPVAAEGELPLLDWRFLGDYRYRLPNPRRGEGPEDLRPDQIPPEVLAFDGQQVEIEGFMLVSRFAHGEVHSFELSRHYMGCCFGRAPRMNEWIVVDAPEGVEAKIGATMRIRGVLQVGELKDESGWVESVYRMTVDEVSFD